MAGQTKVTLEDMRSILGIDRHEPEVEKGKAELDDDGKLTIYGSTLKKLGEEVTDHVKTNMRPELSQVIAEITTSEGKTLAENLQKQLDTTQTELLKLAESVRVVEIKTPKKTKKLAGTPHAEFEKLLRIVNLGQPALLVGPAGTGKTHGSALVAEALDLSFYSISVGSQTSKSDLQGYMDANHNYIPTQFRLAYENGGVFLLDEADAGNSNVLILLNAALSNGYMAFPDKMVKAHADFRMIATANTYGHGANRQYVGRNQLDAATLDRFTVINWDIDEKVEENMAGTTDEGKRWLRVVRAIRKRVTEEADLRVIVSPRATLRGSQLLTAGMPFTDVLGPALLSNMPGHVQKELTDLATVTWNK